MVEIKNTEQEIRRFRVRTLVASLFVLAGFALLFARFFYLQVIRYEDFHAQAEENRIAVVPVQPERGLILDRKGVVMAENVAAYTLEITPSATGDIDKLIETLTGIIEITPKDLRRFKRFREESKTLGTLPLKVRLTDDEVAKLAAVRHRLPGVEVKARLFRNYPHGEVGAHVLGFIGRISPEDQTKIDNSEDSSIYAGATHIGKTGLELSYEKLLHGDTGFDEMEVSAGGRAVRTLTKQAGRPGQSLVLSLDFTLQRMVEQLFGERKGALVAIDPRTGDILAFVSKPGFDPNLFIDGIDTQTWAQLNESPDKPLLNRALRGGYPPGSTYKPFMALAALESGVRTPTTTIYDPGYYLFGGHRFRDSKPGGNGSVALHKSIVVSSDTYYYGVAHDMGVDAIHDFMKPWGFGQITGIDLDGELTGILPSTAWKMKRYKQKWIPGETISIGIGQGYNTFTMLQLAHATATLANDGVAMKPRLVAALRDPRSGKDTAIAPINTNTIKLNPEYLRLVKEAMIDVGRFGTSRVAFAGAEYVTAGKTGTAQVIGIKQGERYDASKIAERYRDHSLFMSYAPADKPRVALALIVENGGFGARAAAPIARQVFDYLLLGKLPSVVEAKYKPAIEADNEEMRDIPLSTEGEPISPAEAARQ
jgi:penicillin-binding protein 2